MENITWNILPSDTRQKIVPLEY